jgi:hypothetical protein
MTGFGYAILGLMLGIFMAASKDHGQFVTHAHIMLLGFVVSFIYALCHKLWLNNITSTLAVTQYYIHLIATFALFVGLFLGYGGFCYVRKTRQVSGRCFDRRICRIDPDVRHACQSDKECVTGVNKK